MPLFRHQFQRQRRLGVDRSLQFHRRVGAVQAPVAIVYLKIVHRRSGIPTAAVEPLLVEKSARRGIAQPHVGEVKLLCPEVLPRRHPDGLLPQPEEGRLESEATLARKKVPREIPPLDLEIGMASVIAGEIEDVTDARDTPIPRPQIPGGESKKERGGSQPRCHSQETFFHLTPPDPI